MGCNTFLAGRFAWKFSFGMSELYCYTPHNASAPYPGIGRGTGHLEHRSTMKPEKVKFSFGKNWRNYARHINAKTLNAATHSLARLLGTWDLGGKTFLDAGCRSGLTAVAALKMGAERVVAIDWDPYSAECTRYVIEKLLGEVPPNVEIKQGSFLDGEFMKSLGTFDVVHAWGVLHHTGRMWDAMDIIAQNVAPGGVLALAIYNRTLSNHAWLKFKRFYNWCPAPIRFFFTLGLFTTTAALRLLKGKNPFRKRSSGMSVWHDSVSWLGGLPYEWASEGEVAAHLNPLGLMLARVFHVTGFQHGNNQFLFRRGDAEK